MRKIILILSSILFGGYLLLCLFFYFFQEKFIFNPDKLAPDYEFQIESSYEEIWFEIPDGLKLHGLLFEADTSRSKGLIFFLHGSGGSVNRYIDRIPAYLDLGYDMFLLDYRGYGKSDGRIKKEVQMYDDVSLVYKEMSKRYYESDIILVGFSMGTIPAAMLAANYNPRAVVIEASPVSVFEKGKRTLPFLPTSLIARYIMDIRKFLPEIKVPVLIFHGELDPGSPVDNALKMKPFLKPTDQFIILMGQGHKDFIFNDQYYKELTALINN